MEITLCNKPGLPKVYKMNIVYRKKNVKQFRNAQRRVQSSDGKTNAVYITKIIIHGETL